MCLQTARNPVCCGEGHLACQECMYESILQQKQAIKKEQRALEQKNQELETQKQINESEAQRVILDSFDKTQNSMLGDRQKVVLKDDVPNSKKRKLEEEEAEAEKETRSINEKAIKEKAIELKREKEEAAKPKIGSFWVVNTKKKTLPYI